MRHSTIAERVHAILSEEYEGHRCLAIEQAHSLLDKRGERPTEREKDLLDWGLVYGLAHGMAVAEAGIDHDPVQLAARAYQEARSVWIKWADDELEPRVTMSPLVDRVLAAFEEAEGFLESAAHGAPAPMGHAGHVRELCARLNRLGGAIGWPTERAAA